jgi:hypothetical protein
MVLHSAGPMDDFKCDVAIPFFVQDIPFATALHGKLSESLGVFY